MIIQMGKGEWLFSMAQDDNGQYGLLIRKAEKAYAIGELDNEAAGKSNLRDDDVFIAMPDVTSALIVQEQIIAAAVAIAGWKKAA